MRHRSVSIVFDFTLFGPIDPAVLAEAIFEHLVSGDAEIEPDGWSIDGWDVPT